MKKTLFTILLVLLLTTPVVQAESLEWISIADNAIFPEEAAISASYPASVTLGQQLYDLDYLLITLLGEDYLPIERGEYADSDEYRSAEGDEPWEYRQISIEDEDKSFRYRNPWVTGERGGEYEAPQMNMLPDESLFLCRALLKDVVPADWLEHVNPSRNIRDRWDYSDRWMTDEEYKSFCYERKSHYFLFDHLTEAGLPIQSDMVFTNVGVDGLSFVEICWRDYAASTEEIAPMPLSEALKMANSTREAPCTLLAARLIYSNWLTEDNTHNLSWYLITDAGNYVVDCVLNVHKCDSYEY